MPLDIPSLGSFVLALILVSAAYTFAVAIAAQRRFAIAGVGANAGLLIAARRGTYATCAFIALAVVLLAYAFQAHDFRIIYVSRYSDRSMPWTYLITSLWGGQDGSLLWWLFLLAGYTAAAVRWLKGKHTALQPMIIATIMGVMLFFCVLMLFAANPFATYIGNNPVDGEGLNPLLQNYWMAIHPPSLYLGFVGWTIPFAFVIAALITGRLDDEWIKAARLWAMVAWAFLSLGLLLGCLWSYEELGWGGYWAWDPVENASFMPWLVGTAYLHTAIVQERYGMMKVWNVFLLCLTFFMTIFGTFLTRSGLIASVHSFARSDIGVYFVHFMFLIAVFCAVLIEWRLPKLRANNRLKALLSREFMFLLNNWILLGMMVFVLGATTWPLISDAFRGEEVTVGPGFYNEWMGPVGLILLFLMGVGPLVSWRKATGSKLIRALAVPLVAGLVAGIAHFAAGTTLGYPAIREEMLIYDTATGVVLSKFHAIVPLIASVTSTMVLVAILQEFWRGARVRMRRFNENLLSAVVMLLRRAPRRYGGYLVHLGIVLMYFGFTGALYDQEAEAALHPGETMEVGGYELRYEEPLMTQDTNKRAIFGRMSLLDDGQAHSQVDPAKYIYRTHPDMPTTEVAIRSRPAEDLYVILSTVDPQTRRATFRVKVRPFVMWIWIGGLVLLFGAIVSMFPSGAAKKRVASETRRAREKRGRSQREKLTSTGPGSLGHAVALIAFSGVLSSALVPAPAEAQDSSSLHAGTVIIEDQTERELFGHLLCECGDCARLPLDTCACGWAEDARADLRMQLEVGATKSELIARYRAQYGAASISIPSDEGFDRGIWAIPVTLILLGGGAVFLVGRRWRQGDGEVSSDEARPADAKETSMKNDDYDALLDDALGEIDGLIDGDDDA